MYFCDFNFHNFIVNGNAASKYDMEKSPISPTIQYSHIEGGWVQIRLSLLNLYITLSTFRTKRFKQVELWKSRLEAELPPSYLSSYGFCFCCSWNWRELFRVSSLELQVSMNDLNICYFYPQGTIFTRDQIIHSEQRHSSGCGEYCRILSPGSCMVDRELLISTDSLGFFKSETDTNFVSQRFYGVCRHVELNPTPQDSAPTAVWSPHSALWTEATWLVQVSFRHIFLIHTVSEGILIISVQIIKVIYFKGDMLQNVLEQQFPISLHCGSHQGLCDY